MEPDQQPIENTESPAEEKPVSSESGGGNRQGRDSRQPRFRRHGRGRRDDRGEQRPRSENEGSTKPAGNIREALWHVEHIRGELRRVLDEMQEVIRILEQAEREKTASEAEVEQLRESLRHLQHDRGHARYPRNPEPRRSPRQESVPDEEESEKEID